MTDTEDLDKIEDLIRCAFRSYSSLQHIARVNGFEGYPLYETHAKKALNFITSIAIKYCEGVETAGYTEEALGVWIKCQAFNGKPTGGEVRLTVRDAGYRLASSYTRRQPEKYFYDGERLLLTVTDNLEASDAPEKSTQEEDAPPPSEKPAPPADFAERAFARGFNKKYANALEGEEVYNHLGYRDIERYDDKKEEAIANALLLTAATYVIIPALKEAGLDTNTGRYLIDAFIIESDNHEPAKAFLLMLGEILLDKMKESHHKPHAYRAFQFLVEGVQSGTPAEKAENAGSAMGLLKLLREARTAFRGAKQI